MAEHPKAMSQIQHLWIEQDNTHEQWTITISNPDSGNYVLNFLNPTTTPASLWKSTAIAANASANQMKGAINKYYNTFWGCNIQVSLNVIDGVYVYTMTVPRMVEMPTASGVTATKSTTVSTISIVSPPSGQQSTTPISGSYMVQCVDPATDLVIRSTEMDFNTHDPWIGNTM